MIDDNKFEQKIDDRLSALFESAESDVVPGDFPARVLEVLAQQRRQRGHTLLAAAVLGGALALPNFWPAMMIVTERMTAIVRM